MDAGGNIILQGNTNITLIVGSSFIEITESEITVNGETMKIIGNRTEVGKPGAAQGMLVNDSGDTYINGKSKVVIKGGEVDIN